MGSRGQAIFNAVTLFTALLGATTGVLSLSLQYAQHSAKRVEDVEVTIGPMGGLYPQPHLRFVVSVLNRSDSPVYVQDVRLRFDEEHLLNKSNGSGLYQTRVSLFPFADLREPLQPKETRIAVYPPGDTLSSDYKLPSMHMWMEDRLLDVPFTVEAETSLGHIFPARSLAGIAFAAEMTQEQRGAHERFMDSLESDRKRQELEDAFLRNIEPLND